VTNNDGNQAKKKKKRKMLPPKSYYIDGEVVPSLIEFGRFLSYEKNDAPHC